MTPKQLRSAAHALRTAANALEDVTTQLRTLSTEIDAPDDKNGPEPEPAAPVWPTAKHMWWDGEVWTRTSIPDGIYETPDRAVWRRSSLDPQSVARRFAREAVPVKLFNALGAEVCDMTAHLGADDEGDTTYCYFCNRQSHKTIWIEYIDLPVCPECDQLFFEARSKLRIGWQTKK